MEASTISLPPHLEDVENHLPPDTTIHGEVEELHPKLPGRGCCHPQG